MSLTRNVSHETMIVHSDNIPDKVLLDFEMIAEGLASTVREGVESFNVGVFGSWGSGKTTLLRLVHSALRGNQTVIPVWFNSWRYQNEEDITLPVLFAIKREVDRRTSSKARQMAKALDKTISCLLQGVSLKAKVIEYDHSKAKKAETEWEQSDALLGTYYDPFIYLQDQVEEIRKKGQKWKIVVFCDDVDRCTPEKAVAVLELIKVFFDIDGFVFVVGIDHKVIHRAFVRMGYDRTHARGFFDKLFQLQVSLPSWKESDIALLIDDLTKSYEDPIGQEVRANSSLIQAAMMPNPRQIKRFLNSLIFLKQVGGDYFEIGPLISVLLLQSRWPTFFEALQDFGESLYHDLSKWIEGKRPSQHGPVIEQFTQQEDLVAFLHFKGNPFWDIHHLDVYLYFTKILTYDRGEQTAREGDIPLDLRHMTELLREEKVTQFNRIRRSHNWRRVDLGSQSLRDLVLNGVSFAKVQMVEATFENCSFTGSDMMMTDFQRAVFSACDLSRCNLTGSNVRGASFSDVDFRGADLSNLKTDGKSRFEECKVDSRTLLDGVSASAKAGLVMTDG